VLLAYGITDKGLVRPNNEDCFAIHESLDLCVVADGMGGHNAGEVAARLAVDAVVAFVEERAGLRASASLAAVGPHTAATGEVWPFGYEASLSIGGNVLRTAIHLANLQILEASIHGENCAGMGTTIVAARVSDSTLTVAHVGDSRLYLRANGQLRQLTRDDSWLAAMIAQDPDADPLLLMHHPMRNVLTNVVGAKPRIDVHVTEQPIHGGDLLLLSTDGVHSVLDDARLDALMGEDDDPRTIAQALVGTALTRGSRDNCTAVVARYVVNAGARGLGARAGAAG
jgi:protein phosphatase